MTKQRTWSIAASVVVVAIAGGCQDTGGSVDAESTLLVAGAPGQDVEFEVLRPEIPELLSPESVARPRPMAGPASAPGTIRIGSFNIANFGDTDEYGRSLISLVNIIREMDADLVCLQEVEPTSFGDDQVQRLTELLNMAATFYDEQTYTTVVSLQTGDEAYAFLYRDPVSFDETFGLRFLEHGADPDGDGKPTFQRTPVYGSFSAGSFDFYVVNCHLYTRINGVSSEGRGAEFDALVAWLEALATEEEKDAIVVGDFNRFLNGKSVWTRLMHPGHESHFRCPLLEGVEAADSGFDPLDDEAPADELSTTTAAKRSLYDQIVIAAGTYHEFPSAAALDGNVGIVTFDRTASFEWPTAKWSDATKLMSDHRPVWVELRIDLADDDGSPSG